MAGRKKSGDLGPPISTRLDKSIDELVRKIAQESAVTANEPGVVIRTIVTAYLMQTRDPLKTFDALALAVNAWRKSYLAGLSESGDDESARAGKARKKNRAEL